jgi:hypothetical protein
MGKETTELAEFSVECGNAEKVIKRTIEKAEAFDWIEKCEEIEIFNSGGEDGTEWEIDLNKNGVEYAYTGNTLLEAVKKAMKGEKTEKNKMSELNKVSFVVICDSCLDGTGVVCHTPGCIFWGDRSPNKPLRERFAIMGCGISKVKDNPAIICLCGSTRFKDAYQKANLEETLAGKIVLSVGCYQHSDAKLSLTVEQKDMLDELHKKKIDLADEIFFLNVGGYMGKSTLSELDYAIRAKKKIKFLEKITPFTKNAKMDSSPSGSNYICNIKYDENKDCPLPEPSQIPLDSPAPTHEPETILPD